MEERKDPIAAQKSAGAIVFEGKVLNTTFEIAEAARTCDSISKAKSLMDAAGTDSVISIVEALCKNHACAKWFVKPTEQRAPQKFGKPDSEAT